MKTPKKSLARYACSLFALFFALGMVGFPMEAMGQGLDLSGDWVLTVTSPNGTGERQITFVQDGHALSGEISSSRAAGELSGTVEENKVTFVAVVQMESGSFQITYTATVTADEMEGIVDFGSYGGGTFTGRRAKPDPGPTAATGCGDTDEASQIAKKNQTPPS